MVTLLLTLSLALRPSLIADNCAMIHMIASSSPTMEEMDSPTVISVSCFNPATKQLTAQNASQRLRNVINFVLKTL